MRLRYGPDRRHEKREAVESRNGLETSGDDANRYRTGASWKSNMTPFRRSQASRRRKIVVHGPHACRPTWPSACRQILEYGAVAWFDAETRRGQQIYVRLSFADVASIVDADHVIEIAMPTCFMAGSRSIGGDVATASFAPLAFNDSRYSQYGLASPPWRHDTCHMVPLLHQPINAECPTGRIVRLCIRRSGGNCMARPSACSRPAPRCRVWQGSRRPPDPHTPMESSSVPSRSKMAPLPWFALVSCVISAPLFCNYRFCDLRLLFYD